MAGANYTPEDVFWGELGGCLEMLEAGTTTVVDHAHISHSPEHNTAALAAAVSSGIRSIYCYTPVGRIKAWKPKLEMEQSLFPDWLWEQLELLCKSGPLGDGRVTMGFGFDMFYLPKEMVIDIFNKVRGLGVKTITSHYLPTFFPGSTVDLLDTYGLLESDILLSHTNGLSPTDVEKLQKANGAISSTPDTELQMGQGWPVCFQDNIKSISSLGVDCHSNNTGSLVAQMRVGLQAERGRRNGETLQAGKLPGKIPVSTQEAFQLGTIRGARAIKMAERLGSLEEGKAADLVVFDTLSPGMICAAEEDPIGAIILHSSVADVDAVLVDGQFRKRGGRLGTTKLDLTLAPNLKTNKTEVQWRDVALQLLQGREKILEAEEESGANDWEAALESVVALSGVKKETLDL
ncbi:hypothetical protein ACO1O0_003147 [Amphichorda felina]